MGGKHWDEMLEAQRFDRARVVVEDGLNQGASMHQVADTVGVSRSTVQEYIDLYATNEGAGWKGGAVATAPINAASQDQIRALRKRYKGQVDVSDEEIAEYGDEYGYSPEVAERFLEGEKIGEMAAEDGLIEDDGGLAIKPARRDLPVSNGGRAGSRASTHCWRPALLHVGHPLTRARPRVRR